MVETEIFLSSHQPFSPKGFVYFSVYLFLYKRHLSYQLYYWLLINHHLRTLQRLPRQDKGSSKLKQENRVVLFQAAPSTSQLFTCNCSACSTASNIGIKEKHYSLSIHPKDYDVQAINVSLRINLSLTAGRIGILVRACFSTSIAVLPQGTMYFR